MIKKAKAEKEWIFVIFFVVMGTLIMPPQENGNMASAFAGASFAIAFMIAFFRLRSGGGAPIEEKA